MAGELHHVDPGPVITQAEYIAPSGMGGHTVNGGVNGDLLYYNGTAITRIVIGAAGTVLTVVAGVPAWGTVGAGAFPLLGPNGSAAAPTYSYSTQSSTGWYLTSAGVLSASAGGTEQFRIQSNVLALPSTASFGWVSGVLGNPFDVVLVRDAANVLAQRNATTAQEFRLYNTFTDASNHERLSMRFSGNTFIMEAAQAGTGDVQSMTIGTLGAATTLTFYTANTNRWIISGSGHFIANADNTYDIGASGATRPRNLYVASSITLGMDALASTLLNINSAVTTGGSVISLLRNSVQIWQSGIDSGATGAKASASDYYWYSTAYRMALTTAGALTVASIVTSQAGGFRAPDGTTTVPSFSFTTDTDTGIFTVGSGTIVFTNNNTNYLYSNGSEFRIRNTSAFSWSSGDPTAAGDLFLFRDAANTLAQRNGTTGQTHNIYGTWTDAANYERLSISGVAGSGYQILTNEAGTGTPNFLRVGTVGVSAFIIHTTSVDRWYVSSDGHLRTIADNTYDIGASGATRPRFVYAGTAFVSGIFSSTGTVASTGTIRLASNTYIYWRDAGNANNLYFGLNVNDKFETAVGLQIGNSTTRSVTQPTNNIDIFNGTAPVGALANGATFYAAAGEMWVMNAAGTPTQLSPHDAEGNWWFNSQKNGKKLEIDVEKILRFVNDKYGLDMVRELEIAGV